LFENGLLPVAEGLSMAETSKGKKFVKVKAYTRKVDGKTIRVPAFTRSTPKTSKGKRGSVSITAPRAVPLAPGAH
jgi:hypothetical protein